MAENINPQDKAAIIKAINYHFDHAKIILFGSRARGSNKEGADVDIAIDLGSPASAIELQRCRVTMENLPTPLMIDLVDLQRAPTELKQRILSEGIVWQT